jgi:hypothetical protein
MVFLVVCNNENKMLTILHGRIFFFFFLVLLNHVGKNAKSALHIGHCFFDSSGCVSNHFVIQCK